MRLLDTSIWRNRIARSCAPSASGMKSVYTSDDDEFIVEEEEDEEKIVFFLSFRRRSNAHRTLHNFAYALCVRQPDSKAKFKD